MRSRARLPLVLAVVATAGCGGDDEGHPKGAVEAFSAGQPVRVVAKEYFFTPARVRTEGKPIRLELDNEGTLAHDLRVVRGGRDLGGTPTFALKATRGGSLTLAPGRYRMVCTVANHEQLGMVGELEVTR
jgi:plastocyanin